MKILGNYINTNSVSNKNLTILFLEKISVSDLYPVSIYFYVYIAVRLIFRYFEVFSVSQCHFEI